MKAHLKKYSLHWVLFLLIAFALVLSVIIDYLVPTDMTAISQVFIDSNKLIHIPRFRLNTGLYIYYLVVFFSALIFYIIPKKWQWAWLILISSCFLILWDVVFYGVLALVTCIAFFSGLRIQEQGENSSRQGLILRISLIALVALLFLFKYGAQLSSVITLQILMPIGISYYSFKAISYMLDVFNGKMTAEKHLGYFAVYMAFFPKLFVGPIDRAESFLFPLKQGVRLDYSFFLDGVVRIFGGLFKRLMLVNRLVVTADRVFANPSEFSGLEIWTGVFFFGLYVYFDFSAFTDIAIGSGQLFGLHLTENFKQPLLASSVSDFWRRWHISLTSWLRDYIFIPLNFSSRYVKGKIAHYSNIVITFLISGIWHGATLNFILWGGMHGLYQVIEDLIASQSKKIAQRFNIHLKGSLPVSILVTYLAVNIAWVFFRAESVRQAIDILRRMFTGKNFMQFRLNKLGLPKADFLLACIFILFLMVIEILEKRDIQVLRWLQRQSLPVRWLIYLAGLFSMIILGYYGSTKGSIDPFYMRF